MSQQLSLKNIAPKAIWGMRQLPGTCNILATGDNEYIIPAGSTVMAFDNNVHTDRRTTLLNPRNQNVLCVTLMAHTADSKYLLTVVKVNDNDDNVVRMLVYKLEHQIHDVNLRKPKEIQYKNTAFIAGGSKFEFTCAAFSDDSCYFACGSNVPSTGVVIFDNMRSCVFQTIATDTAALSVSFSPLDSTKICVTGESGMIKFWRFTAKSVHVAPVVGLKSIDCNYTCNVWVSPYSEGLVIVGSNTGLLTMIVGCEQKGSNVTAFSKRIPQDQGPDQHSISQILVRGDLLLVASASVYVTAFEIRRMLHGKGVSSLSPTLFPLKHYRLPSTIGRLLGMQWCMRESVTSLSVMAVSTSSVFQADIISEKDIAEVGNPSGGPAGLVSPKASRPTTPASLSPRSAAGHSGFGDSMVRDTQGNLQPQNDEIVDVTELKTIFRFHSGAIHGLSVAARTNTLVSNSFEDATIRVWDFNRPTSFKGSWIVESFKERPQENPFNTDIHPYGQLVACAIEGEVREYTVTDSNLDLYRRISVKAPFIGPTGTAHLITQPVSLVRYSNGGQYLAVIAGKIAQIFHATRDDFSGPNGIAQPLRLMVMSDHIAPITDLVFSKDDAMIYTSSSDGSVYSWKFGNLTRDQEFVFKGVPATKLCVTKHKAKQDYIVASYECQAESKLLLAAEVVKTRRRSSLAMRRASVGGDGLLRASTKESLTSAALSQLLGDAADPYTEANSQSKNIQQGRKKPFLAVWKDNISSTPQIIYLDTPVRSMVIGESDGPDKFDFCALGLADGRVLLTLLPFPIRVVDSSSIGLTATPMPTTGAGQGEPNAKHRNILSRTGTARSRKKQSSMAFTMADAASRAVGTIHESQDEGTDNDTAATEIESGGGDLLDNATLGSQNDASASGIRTVAGMHDETPGNNSKEILDESKCRSMRMHMGSVNRVLVSQNGLWMFSAGEDGMVYLYSTSRRGSELLEIPSNPDSQENNYLVVDKYKLQGLVNQLFEAQLAIEASKKDYALKVEKIVESREKMVYELETRMKKEIKHRDDAIVTGRHEYLKLKNSMHSEINAIRKQCKDQISELELAYEERLSQEGLYLDKMKQAYDEYVVHAQMDLDELRQRTEQKVVTIETEKQQALKESEKQKDTVMKYFEYMKLRNDELYQSLEEKQVEERFKLKDELDGTNQMLQKAQASILTGEVQANREINKLKTVIDEREREVLKLRSDVDWANSRIIQLEHALQQSTAELNSRTELSDKWELKSGEMQQKIIELEKLRKVLTTQLHNLRQELGPKEETLMNVNTKLQETEREYEHSMHAIAEKEKALHHKGESLSLLQKQVRELRMGSSRKESLLRRAATLLDEYKLALRQAYFSSEKRSVGKGGVDGAISESAEAKSGGTRKKALDKTVGDNAEVVEIIAQNDGMKTALKRLNDILMPFLDEENIDAEMMDELEAVRSEQERHINQLHRSVNGLKANLELSQSVAGVKVANHRSDNQNLLKEVNALRTEVRNLSLENQRLSAQMEFTQATTQRRRSSVSMQALQNFQNNYSNEPVRQNFSSRKAIQDQPYFTDTEPVNPQNIEPFSSNIYNAAEINSAPQNPRFSPMVPDPAAVLSTVLASSTGQRTPPRAVSKSASASILPPDRKLQTHQPDLSKTLPGQSSLPQRSVSNSVTAQSPDNRSAVSGSSSELPSKNEYVISADDKIAALLEMNAQELKANGPIKNSKTRKSIHVPGQKAQKNQSRSGTADTTNSYDTDAARSVDSVQLHSASSSREANRRSLDPRQSSSKSAIQLPSVFGAGLHVSKR